MRAAIYSRKSKFTGKGESIENQIQLCKEYGDKLNIEEYLIYEDEGFSGGNINRPEFKRLLDDARGKKFDILICYRLDRISRNIGDFSNLINELESLQVNFISIKEQFDTSTPLGRAMMYIASVFAQLERETIAERIRDNMLELAKTGRWLGGQTPLGFESEEVKYIDSEFKERIMYKLSPVPSELDIVKIIYDKYLSCKSINKVYKYMFSNNIKTKLGADWTKKKIQLVLRNPLYVKSSKEVLDYLESLGMNVTGEPNGNGILTYNKSKGIKIKRDITEWIAAVSNHKGLIDSHKWILVQKLLTDNKCKAPRLSTSSVSILTGLLKCSKCGSNMLVKHGHISHVTRKRYLYYVCSTKDNSNGIRCNCKNIRVDELENAILSKVGNINIDNLLQMLKDYKKQAPNSEKLLNPLESIKNEISLKEKSIENLVKKLSIVEDDSLSKYIINEIKNLNIQIEALNSSLDYAKYNEIQKTSSYLNFPTAAESLQNLQSTFNLINDIDYKRVLINSLISKIYWNSDIGQIDVYFHIYKNK